MLNINPSHKINKEKLDGIHKNIPSDYYDQGIRNNFWQRYFHKRRFKVIERILKEIKPEKVLDIGCHAGTLTTLIHQWTGADTFAVDLSGEAIRSRRYCALRGLVISSSLACMIRIGVLTAGASFLTTFAKSRC